jgi:hypothetical protein
MGRHHEGSGNNIVIYVRFEAFTAVTMKNVVFWDVALCMSCVNRRFGGTYSLHLQGRKREHDARSTKLRRSIHARHFSPRSYWVNSCSVALAFSPPPTRSPAACSHPSLPDCMIFTTDPTPLLSIDFFHVAYSLSPCYLAGCFRLVAQSEATCSRWFLALRFLYSEDGGNTLLRNVG